MKKVFDSFYVFSKFSLSFILLLCVFFLVYLLYTNYQNEDEVSKLQIELENEFRENINKNAEFIKNISCLLYTSPSPRDEQSSRMPSSA